MSAKKGKSEESNYSSLWVRWTDRQDNLHFHKIIQAYPDLELNKRLPFIRIRSEKGSPPKFRDPDTGEDRTFSFINGLPRQALRHTTFVVLSAFVFLFASAEVSLSVSGLSQFIPSVDGWLIIFLLGWSAPLLILIFLVYKVGVIGDKESSLVGSSINYGFPVVLAIGAAYCLFSVFVADSPNEIEANVVFVSGYLLTILIGGNLFYEGILRVENLMVSLEENQIVTDSEEYRRFLSDLMDDLEMDIYGVRASTLFGLGLAFQFGLLWIVGEGPQHLDYPVNIAINVILNTVLSISAFQFIVLIHYFNEILREDGDYAEALGYDPFHVDGYAGYRDLGRFAVRFNILIGLGGLFLVYRLYTNGARALPSGGIAGLEGLDLLLWLMNYVGPIGIYGAIMFGWAYYTFWGIHMKMFREKDKISRRYQGSTQTDGMAGAGVPAKSIEGGPTWQDIRDLPEWPSDAKTLRRIISGNVITLLLPLPELLIF